MQDTEQCSSSLLKSLAVLAKILSQDPNRPIKEETESPFKGLASYMGSLSHPRADIFFFSLLLGAQGSHRGI